VRRLLQKDDRRYERRECVDGRDEAGQDVGVRPEQLDLAQRVWKLPGGLCERTADDGAEEDAKVGRKGEEAEGASLVCLVGELCEQLQMIWETRKERGIMHEPF
jgi:hypothetical protein